MTKEFEGLWKTFLDLFETRNKDFSLGFLHQMVVLDGYNGSGKIPLHLLGTFYPCALLALSAERECRNLSDWVWLSTVFQCSIRNNLLFEIL